MDRIEVEATLNKDRAWLIEAYAALSPADQTRQATASEHDPSQPWSALDHLAHLAGIERAFNAMIERHIGGDANPVGLTHNPDGSQRSMDDVMRGVHRMNEEFVQQHRGKPLAKLVALGQGVRGETLALMGRLSDAQLAEKLPGAPWADGTIGGVIATNALHGRQHWTWIKEGLALT